jgi:hypothetical protein
MMEKRELLLAAANSSLLKGVLPSTYPFVAVVTVSVTVMVILSVTVVARRVAAGWEQWRGSNDDDAVLVVVTAAVVVTVVVLTAAVALMAMIPSPNAT